MKRFVLLNAVILLSMIITSCKDSNYDNSVVPTESMSGEVVINADTEDTSDDASAQLYKDGVYTVETPLDYEKYYTKATVTIEGGKITSLDWTIIDTGHDDVPFDEEYYNVMEPYGELYVQQAKDDWSGSRGYSDVLIKTQDVDQVDAVSGATWTNKKFKEVVRLALRKAKGE